MSENIGKLLLCGGIVIPILLFILFRISGFYSLYEYSLVFIISFFVEFTLIYLGLHYIEKAGKEAEPKIGRAERINEGIRRRAHQAKEPSNIHSREFWLLLLVTMVLVSIPIVYFGICLLGNITSYPCDLISRLTLVIILVPDLFVVLLCLVYKESKQSKDLKSPLI